MPIYEYQCDHCGHHLEALQKISDKPLRECPECGRHRLKRLMSAPLFRLAGSGWYETDFKSDKEAKRNLLDKGDREPAPEAKAEPKSEGAAEAKTPEKTVVPAPKPVVTSGRPARARAPKGAARSSAKAPVRKKAPARARRR